jgi:hypothetical protein
VEEGGRRPRDPRTASALPVLPMGARGRGDVPDVGGTPRRCAVRTGEAPDPGGRGDIPDVGGTPRRCAVRTGESPDPGGREDVPNVGGTPRRCAFRTRESPDPGGRSDRREEKSRTSRGAASPQPRRKSRDTTMHLSGRMIAEKRSAREPGGEKVNRHRLRRTRGQGDPCSFVVHIKP